MKESLQILTEMRNLLSSPEKWTQHTYAKNRDGSRVQVTDPEAVCFCLMGAFDKMSAGKSATSASEVIDFLHNTLFKSGYPSIVSFNDSVLTYHGDVLRLLDQTIRDAKAQS